MLNSLLKWFNGYLMLEITAGSPERFMNVCRKRNIYLWNIKEENRNYFFCISIKDYKRINDIAYKCKTYPKQINRMGYPFILSALIKMKTLLPAFALFVFSLIYLSGFVWNISVYGQSRYTQEAIKEYLETKGLRFMMRKNSLKADSIEKQMRIDYKDIGWVSISLDATNVTVKILESDMPDTIDSASEFTDIIATEDGVIKSIITRSGIAKVHIGDNVVKGQVLVSGMIDLYNDSGEIYKSKPVNADADIVIQTRKKYSDSFPIIYDDKFYTGRKKTAYTICCENSLINLENILNIFETYEKYDIINESVFSGFLTKKIINEYEIITKTYNKNELHEIASANLKQYLDNYKGLIKVNDKNINIRTNNGICEASGWIDMYISQDTHKVINIEDRGVIQGNE